MANKMLIYGNSGMKKRIKDRMMVTEKIKHLLFKNWKKVKLSGTINKNVTLKKRKEDKETKGQR